MSHVVPTFYQMILCPKIEKNPNLLVNHPFPCQNDHKLEVWNTPVCLGHHQTAHRSSYKWIYDIWHYILYDITVIGHSTIRPFQHSNGAFWHHFQVKLIDFSMAVPGQKVTCGHRGKPSYQAGTCRWENSRFFFLDAGFLKREVDRFLEFVWDFKLFRTWDLRFVFGQILSVLAFFFWCVFFAETIALYFFCKNRSLFSCCLSGEIRDFYILFTKLVSEIVSQPTWRFLACVQTLAVV